MSPIPMIEPEATPRAPQPPADSPAFNEFSIQALGIDTPDGLAHYSDIVPCAIFTVDNGRRITSWNREAERITGYPAAEILGKPCCLFAEAPCRETCGLFSDTPKPLPGKECTIRRKDGELRIIAKNTDALRDSEGTVVGGIECFTDITQLKQAEDGLRRDALAEHLISVFDGIEDVIYVADPDTYELLFVNRAFKQLWGSDPVGLKCHQVLQGLDQPCPFCTNARILGDNLGKGYVWECRKQTTGRWFRCADKAIQWPGGKWVRFELAIDITERKRAEEALHLKNLVFDGSIAANSTADTDGIITEANDAFVTLWGCAGKDEVIGKSIAGFFQDPEEASCVVRALDETGAWRGSFTAKRSDGSTFVASSLATVLRDEEARVIGYQSSVVDITEQEQAKRDLIQAELRARKVGELKERMLLAGDLPQQLKSVTDAVVDIFDADFARVWIIEPGDDCGNDCIHAEQTEGPHVCRYRDRCLHLVASSGRYTHTDGKTHRRIPFGCYKIGRVAAGDEPKFITNDAAHDPRVHDHEWVERLGLVSFAGYRLLSPDGKPLGVLALFCKQPISAQDDACLDDVAATASLAVQTAHARRARAELEDQLLQAQKLEAIGTLAGGVAHEINNPIMGIMNYAQLILDRLGPDSPVAEFATEIGEETQRVATLVKNLLSFARQDKETHRSPARMCDIVESTLSLVRAVMRHDQITIETSIPEDLPKIGCRSQQVRQVIMNLLTNARDALNEKYAGHDDDKKIVITARVHGGRQASAAGEAAVEADRPPVPGAERRLIRLTVEDHGPGIPESVRNRIFDPFFTTKPRDKGTGLGLSISHGIINDHGGELSVESEVGQWTRFHVDLPVDSPALGTGTSELREALQAGDERVCVPKEGGKE